MSGLLQFARLIDWANEKIGHSVAFLTVLMVLVTVVVVVLRYGFSIGFIWMQESVRFMHGFVFMLCAGYTLLHNGHVRVDVFYNRLGEKGKARVDIIGSLFFLMPVCVAIVFYSWDYVLNSWSELEGSLEERGIHAVYLLKSCIWLFAGLMILQAVSRVIHGVATLIGHEHGDGEQEMGPL